MSNTNHSVRLHRTQLYDTGRRTSISEYQPKDTLKLAAIRSIAKGIKHNDLSYITGVTTNKLRVEQPLQVGELEIAASHQTLANIRRKYDDLKRQKLQRQQEVQNLKDELQKAKKTQMQYISKKKQAKANTANLVKMLEAKKLNLDETWFEKKSVDYVKFRLKEDKFTISTRIVNLEKQLKNQNKQLEILRRQQTQVGESTDRTKKVHEKLLKQLQQEKKERDDHILELNSNLKNLSQMNNSTVVLQKERLEIAQRAMQDKDHKEKQWRNLLCVNKLMSVMLKNKMETQMVKFAVVEKAFKTIKIQTGVNDTNVMVSKFLNKQSDYGELLNKIAESEKKIEDLKKQNELLNKQKSVMDAEQNVFDSIKTTNVNLQRQLKQLENNDEKVRKTELQQQNLMNWIERQMKKLIRLGDIKKESFSKDNIQNAFESYFEWLQNNLDVIEKQQATRQLDIKIQQIDKKEYQKMSRVKLVDTEEQDEEPEVSTGLEDEDYYVSGLRNNLHKENDKFFKELHRKGELLAKLRMDQTRNKTDE